MSGASPSGLRKAQRKTPAPAVAVIPAGYAGSANRPGRNFIGKSVPYAVVCLALLSFGCQKSQAAFKTGAKAEAIHNYDQALEGYSKAAKKSPRDAQSELKEHEMRFEAAQMHVSNGLNYLRDRQTQLALKEFQTALEIDPSSGIARQELEYTQRLLAAEAAAEKSNSGGAADADLIEAPPALVPLSREPISLKLNADSRTVFRTIGKLAGVNVVFDPEYQERKISVDLVNVTIHQALSAACIEGKAFWKPVSSNIIKVMPEAPQKRKEEEEQVLQKIYLEHVQTAQELTEITTSLQQMLELRHVQAVPHDNAILVRDTPAKVLLASRLIRDSDRGRPEVLVQISVLQVRRDRARSLGIQPGSSTTLAFNPATALAPVGGVALDKLSQLSQHDFTVTIPNAVATALLTDSSTKIIQNPEVRVSDGESAKLRVGDRIPIATGSFQAAAGIPLVNTQFQYVDVGVNIDLVPHVHPDHSVSMKLAVEVSSLNGQVDIGGVSQPIISQRRIEHEIRLQEGEVSILGGLAERSQSKSVSGWPGLSRLPLLRYLFSGEDLSNSENEVLVVIHPRLVRMRDFATETLKAMSVGTDGEINLRHKDEVMVPVAATVPANQGSADPQAGPVSAEKQLEQETTLEIEPQKAEVAPGGTVTARIKLENVEDLFSSSLLLKYDPQLLSIEDVRHGDFLSGGTQEVAIIQRIDKEKGEARIFTTRQPNTAGVSGKGNLLTIIVRRLTAAPATLQVVEVGARTARQKPISITIAQGSLSIR